MRTFTKDTALSEQGRGAAWHVWINERHGHGMLCVNQPLIIIQYYIRFTEVHTHFGVASSLFTNIKWSRLHPKHLQQSLWLATISCRFDAHFCPHWIPCTGNIEKYITDCVSVLKVFYCTFVIHQLAKEISLIITLHILYGSLVHWLYKGHHIWRKVKNQNISRLQFKIMRVCIATIK